jgi:hypothetical protein
VTPEEMTEGEGSFFLVRVLKGLSFAMVVFRCIVIFSGEKYIRFPIKMGISPSNIVK